MINDLAIRPVGKRVPCDPHRGDAAAREKRLADVLVIASSRNLPDHPAEQEKARVFPEEYLGKPRLTDLRLPRVMASRQGNLRQPFITPRGTRAVAAIYNKGLISQRRGKL